jgi:hypothetical protein
MSDDEKTILNYKNIFSIYIKKIKPLFSFEEEKFNLKDGNDLELISSSNLIYMWLANKNNPLMHITPENFKKEKGKYNIYFQVIFNNEVNIFDNFKELENYLISIKQTE